MWLHDHYILKTSYTSSCCPPVPVNRWFTFKICVDIKDFLPYKWFGSQGGNVGPLSIKLYDALSFECHFTDIHGPQRMNPVDFGDFSSKLMNMFLVKP